MKQQHSLKRSGVSRLNKAIQRSVIICELLKKQKEKFCPQRQQLIRETLSNLTQDFHEFNAYWNALETI